MSRPPYLFLTVVIAFILIAVTSLIINYQLIYNMLVSGNDIGFKLSFMFNILGSIITNNTELSLLTLVITGLLAGINVAFMVFKFRTSRRDSIDGKSSGLGGGGVLAGMLGAGCSSCGVGILALLGVVGGAAILPFGGYEIWAVSTAILVYSMYSLSKGINSCDSCQVELNHS